MAVDFSGGIPTKLIITTRQPRVVTTRFDDLGDGTGYISQCEVSPAFASDATNPKTLETARNWAKGPYWSNTSTPGEEIAKDNTPFKNLKLVGLEVRTEGGRAWKVVTEDNLYFDLREDVLLEAQIAVGIRKGGFLNGEYIWAKAGSHMKIVRVGSALHDKLIEATNRGKLKKISYNSLTPGGVYQTKAGKTSMFLGWVSTTQYVNSTHKDSHWRAYSDGPVTWTKTDIPKIGLFFESDTPTLEHLLNSGPWWFELKKSTSFVLQVGTIQLPDDIVANVRDRIRVHTLDYSTRCSQSLSLEQVDTRLASDGGLHEMVPIGSLPEPWSRFDSIRGRIASK